ncbi:acyl-CoA dehydrogenase family protein [Comamonas sp. UBA7528]|uniref:acyl-CoA dehydrogenase family protein n=1 Tax=Comamonas sp. UBA7528 TaxID=1946391 RepID=UPI0025BB9F35|nr:acyl-CoA dehydrogenase family protein [Comamonas sp. UBA7528]
MASDDTHEVFNQVDEPCQQAPLQTDAALLHAVQQDHASWALPSLQDYAQRVTSPATWQWAQLANTHPPRLQAFDARGRRTNTVHYHPCWHALLTLYREQGLVGLPYENTRAGRWTAWAAGFYLHGQVEQGSLCPATMTTAAIGVLRHETALWPQIKAGLLSRHFDAQDRPWPDKQALWVGMGMTEKQGGSDVRANTTQAVPDGAPGRGQAYRLTGHKWFFSAPMSDAHLVVAQTPDAGPACFWVPRWQPDGTRNTVHLLQLKDKVGNRSNASSEVEFHGAYGLLLGEPGRGIPTIIEMATTTRLCCVLGSSAILRQALVQALHHAQRRQAFGKPLVQQPLMRSVLVDLALESEAATMLAMRLASAFEACEGADPAPAERAWKRLMTPAAKFWVCKRAVEVAGEAMEVLGGNGYVEPAVVARLFREAPVNSIWEGSGNIMCLDMLRALGREPEGSQALLTHLMDAAGEDSHLLTELHALQALLHRPPAEQELLARLIAQKLVLVAQACLLRRHAPSWVADAFIATRIVHGSARVVGAIDARTLDVAALLERALPA